MRHMLQIGALLNKSLLFFYLRRSLGSVALTLTGVLLNFNALNAQLSPCETKDPSIEVYQQMRADVERIKNRAEARSKGQNETVHEIPINVTVVRSQDGVVQGAGSLNITTWDIDYAITYLNDKVQGTNLHFYRLGNINYVDSDVLNQDNFNGLIANEYSYVSNALNTYIRQGSVGFAHQPGDNLPSSPIKDNSLHLNPITFGTTGVYAHETGHNFKLLHTFGIPQLYRYPEVLTNTNVIDHPIDGLFPRELVIRDYTAGLNFPSPNRYYAGDLCWDTEADCTPAFTRSYPEFDLTNISNCINGPTNCIPGCAYNACANQSTYKDYNEQPIVGELSNIMATTYHETCGNLLFTECQKARMSTTYDDFWSSRLSENLSFNLADKVEYKGTAEPVRNVTIRWRFPNVSHYVNSITNSSGDFQSILHQSNVKAEVRKIGSTTVNALWVPQNPPPGGSFVKTDDYTWQDWLEKLNTQDLLCISRHTLNLDPIDNGYDLLAADGNRSGSITNFDIVELRKLILGVYTKMPNYLTPWLFVPEFIPQDNQVAFDSNPFNMNINGVNVSSSTYTSSNWVYPMPAQSTGKNGYDGIKIGDVCKVGPMLCEIDEMALAGPGSLFPGVEYDIDITAAGFTSVEGFQIGFNIDSKLLQVLDVEDGNLPEYSKEENIGLTMLENDILNMSWMKSDLQPVSLTGQNNKILTIKVKALEPVSSISEAISIKNGKNPLKTEFYNASGCVPTVSLTATFNAPAGQERSDNWSNREDAITSEIYCFPNPVSESVKVGFESNHEGEGIILVQSISENKVIFLQPVKFNSGLNLFPLDASEFQNLQAGVYLISLVSKGSKRTTKVVKF